jgi:hypothetical protein
MIIPEARFTHRSVPKPSLERNRLTPPLKSNHHRADPENTPKTSTVARTYPALSTKPSPAKIAAKERSVKGLVMVSKKVEEYALASPP